MSNNHKGLNAPHIPIWYSCILDLTACYITDWENPNFWPPIRAKLYPRNIHISSTLDYFGLINLSIIILISMIGQTSVHYTSNWNIKNSINWNLIISKTIFYIKFNKTKLMVLWYWKISFLVFNISRNKYLLIVSWKRHWNCWWHLFWYWQNIPGQLMTLRVPMEVPLVLLSCAKPFVLNVIQHQTLSTE